MLSKALIKNPKQQANYYFVIKTFTKVLCQAS